jgi:type 1 glutamine amidotransferase
MFKKFGLLALCVGLCGVFAFPAVSRAADDKPIKALFICGGCCHDYEHQKDILTRGISSRANVQWTIAYDPDTTTGHKNPIYEKPDWSKDFDVVVHDECTSGVKDMDTIETILRPHKAGLPGVVLHCGMHSYRTEGWDKKVATPWMQFTGLISTGHGPQQPIAITFVDQDHPITKSLGDWATVNEELYNNASGKLEPTAHALARGKQVYTAFPKKDGKVDRTAGKEVTAEAVVVWTNTYNGKTKVFSTTLGHNNATVDDPRYLDLVTRGLLWSVGKLDAEHLKPAE